MGDISGPGPILLVLSLATISSALLTPLSIRVARRLHIFDLPGGYKAHGQPTPLLGGIAVASAMALALLAAAALGLKPDPAPLAPLAVGLGVILIAGLIDDIRGLPPRFKLIWQVSAALAAAAVVSIAGVRLELFLSWGALPIVLLTIAWIVGVTNAVNFLDNMNGLCAGMGAVAAVFLAFCNARTGQDTIALAAAALGGACLGFLPFNWPRARCFLGDTGSMTVGFGLAALAVMGVYTPGAQVPLLAVQVPLFILAIPLADAVLVVLLRLRAGHPPWLGDRRHISHRLVRRGLPPATAVAVIWLGCAICGFAALLVPVVGLAETPLLVALVGGTVGLLGLTAGTDGLE